MALRPLRSKDSLERESDPLQNQEVKFWAKTLLIPLLVIALGMAILSADPLTAFLGGRAPASRELAKKDSEKAEVKLQIDPTDLARVLGELEAQNAKSKNRRIYFFDSPELSLFSQGIILRARLNESGKDAGEGDTTVKIREDAKPLDRDGFKCEWDIAQTAKRACSYTKDRSALDFARVLVSQDRSIDSLFSSKQLDYLEDHLAAPVSWDSLQILGPIYSKSWKFKIGNDDEEWSVELWEIPGVTKFLELSARSDLQESDHTFSTLRSWCESKGIRWIQNSTTKTEWVLKYFSKQK